MSSRSASAVAAITSQLTQKSKIPIAFLSQLLDSKREKERKVEESSLELSVLRVDM